MLFSPFPNIPVGNNNNTSGPMPNPLSPLGGGDHPDPKPKYNAADEMKTLSGKPLKYDNNRNAIDITREVAQKTGVNPAFLFSSAFQEGMNKAIAKPDDISEGYFNAKVDKNFPVDGFYNYGLDTFGGRFKDLVKKGYLPQDFASRFTPYPAYNEKKEPITTAAFRTNADALTAKAAMLKDGMDTVNSYAQQHNIPLDDKARQYFTLALFNGGPGNAQKMMNEYANAKDKNSFIDKGQTTRKGVHVNIAPRMQNMATAAQFFNQQ